VVTSLGKEFEMSDREVLTLPLQRAEVNVVLTGDDLEGCKWLLQELSGAQRNKYLNRMSNRIKIGAGGRTTIKSFDGFHSDLLCICLVDEAGDAIPKGVIEDLPSSTQLALFTKAQEISGLDEKEDDEKND